jgi:glucose/arabinose dehydrogenase
MNQPRRRLPAPAVVFLLAAASAGSAAGTGPGSAKAPFPVDGQVPGVRLEQIAANLSSITGITSAGDARLFLTLRDGRIVIYENGAVRPTPFLDLRGQLSLAGERGLLSTAFHPRYAENGFFFVYYSNLSDETVIARFHVSADPNRADAQSGRTLLRIAEPFSNHQGGQLQFGPDGFLYAGLGDGGSAFDPGCRAQKDDTLLGKMLRLDVDQNVDTPPFYGIPADNPFRGAGGPLDEIWAKGFRNPWRFAFDRQTGDLWVGDVGQNLREEIDFQPASSHGGENYGWKVMEATLCSSSDACPGTTPACNAPAYTLPVLEYDHASGCSVTGGYVYRGALQAVRGAYFFGDFCTGEVWAAFRQGGGFTVRGVEGRVSQLTTFGEDAAAELYAGSLDGRLYRLRGEGVVAAAETVGLFEPIPSRFQLKRANSASAAVDVARFGPRRNGWRPLAGDWDGDGETTVGFYDPAVSLFRLDNKPIGGGSDVLLQLGTPASGVVPIVGDWDGDGRDTVGLFDRVTATFRLVNDFDGSGFDLEVRFGEAGETRLPVAGDWDGDGRDGVGLYDPLESVFALRNSLSDGGPELTVRLGPRNRQALPVAGDWDGDGRDGIGIYDPAAAIFRLENALVSGSPDLTFRFGPRRAGWLPLAGAW